MPGQATTATRTIVMTGGTHGLGRVAAIKILQDAPEAHVVVLTRSDGDAIAEKLPKPAGTRT